MAKEILSHFNILDAKKAYANGFNITEMLRTQIKSTENTSEIIEVAYDIQAGNYIDYAEKNPVQSYSYTSQVADLLGKYISPNDSLLDIGSGELTTISQVINHLQEKPSGVLAFDISWSRIYKGLNFAKNVMGAYYDKLISFVANIEEIPLLDKSVSVTTSSHALEPNGGKLRQLMQELFRVTSNKLVLFEPCYEINSEEGKQRMDRLGYIKNIEGVINDLGGHLLEKIVIESTNKLNPTVCFVISPPESKKRKKMGNYTNKDIFSVPGTNIKLNKLDDYYFSNQCGLCYPILKSIPILKSASAIIASALSENFND